MCTWYACNWDMQCALHTSFFHNRRTVLLWGDIKGHSTDCTLSVRITGTENIAGHEGVTKSFRTGLLERELQIVKFSPTSCSCVAIFWVSLVSFAAITLCVTSQRVFIVISVYFFMTQSGNFWIHPSVWLLISVVLPSECRHLVVRKVCRR
jgi:hypothetical protein